MKVWTADVDCLRAQWPGHDWKELAQRLMADDPKWRRGVRFRLARIDRYLEIGLRRMPESDGFSIWHTGA